MNFPVPENDNSTGQARRNPGEASSRCPVCAAHVLERPDAAAALWPLALGGAHAPALFHNARFCAACTELSESLIDSAFLKSWSMQEELSRAALTFLDPAAPGPAPLIYLGIAGDYDPDNQEICERWAGLAGEQIYHISPRVDESFHGHDRMGIYEAQRQRRNSKATLILNSASQFWSNVAILSFNAYFPHAERFVLDRGTSETPASTSTTAFNQHHSPRQRAYIGNGSAREALIFNSGLSGDAMQRFLIKLALGMGANLLGPEFLATATARRLKRNFWLNHPVAPPITRKYKALRPIEGSWMLTLAIVEDEFALRICTPSGQTQSVLIAKGAHLWSGPSFDPWREGQVFIVIPQRNIFAGPFASSLYQAHMEGGLSDPELASLQALRTSHRRLPSRTGLA
ncbi:MAG: hypothetical protein KGQ46_05245 [Hyphomicrobiales bacterium]|nr:hypothetical protein [Hyphomicrobiales bacterium]MDE2113491.1 hypothetical protein [Hyphomicrobiales bacterium]